MEEHTGGKKKYYRDDPSMMDPNIKCPINKKEIRHELEERIRETEDGIELAALVLAWHKMSGEDIIERQVPQDVQTGMVIKEVLANVLMFILGSAIGIGILMLLTRL
mgnify:CR=1 FL=1